MASGDDITPATALTTPRKRRPATATPSKTRTPASARSCRDSVGANSGWADEDMDGDRAGGDTPTRASASAVGGADTMIRKAKGKAGEKRHMSEDDQSEDDGGSMKRAKKMGKTAHSQKSG